jgi:hypothetical protein
MNRGRKLVKVAAAGDQVSKLWVKWDRNIIVALKLLKNQ